MHDKEFLECVMYSRNSDVYISYMVANWACDVTLILTQNRLLCLTISVTSQAQLATTTPSYFCCN